MQMIDETDNTYGRLVVLYRHEKNHKTAARWVCKCQCGNTTVVVGHALRTANTTSCGCLSSEIISSRNKKTAKHGLRFTPIYRVWRGMINRCENRNSESWIHYGGRGIKVCDRWRNSVSSFYEDMGERPNGLSIDRINNDGDYTPENCRWADNTQQNRNKSNVKLNMNIAIMIRKMIACGDTQNNVSRRFNVSQSLVSQISLNKIWRIEQ